MCYIIKVRAIGFDDKLDVYLQKKSRAKEMLTIISCVMGKGEPTYYVGTVGQEPIWGV